VHSQGVDLSSLGNMGMLERLNDLIETPIESLFGRFKEMNKERVHKRGWSASTRGTHLRLGHVGPKGHEGLTITWVHGHVDP
jgi:hypothetical protein